MQAIRRLERRDDERRVSCGGQGRRPREASVVGERRTVVDTRTTRLHLVAPGQEVDLEETDAKEMEEETLSVAGDVVTKLRVTYVKDARTVKPGTSSMNGDPRLAGKSYILSLTGDIYTVAAADGKAAPPTEVSVVIKDHPSFGKAEPFASAAPSRRLAEGEGRPRAGGGSARRAPGEQPRG